jgi:NhaP-type Na+/H+ or K+/H+ antiporter
MELTIIAVAAVVAIVAVAAVSQRIAVAAPLSMVVVGIALSFLPGLPKIEVDPEWILAGALPPLLYATAVHVPAHDFRRDFTVAAAQSLPDDTPFRRALDLMEATLQQIPDLANPESAET